MAHICVFCGARTGNNPLYMEVAYQLGEEITKR